MKLSEFFRGESPAPRLDSVGIPRLNLLPEPVRVRTAALERLRQWGFALIVAVGVLLGGWQAASDSGVDAGRARAALRAEFEAHRKQQKISARLLARAELVRQRQRQLLDVRAKHSWSEQLAHLAEAVPADIVIRRLRIAPIAANHPGAVNRKPTGTPEQPREIEIRMEGLASRHESITRLQSALAVSPGLREVRLVRSGAAEMRGAGAYEFTLACRR